MAPLFIIMAIVSAGLGIYFMIIEKRIHIKTEKVENDNHPLEIKVAFAFTVLFIAFSFITYYAITTFGKTGLNILSWVVGVTDIDPFLINLFQGKFEVTMQLIGVATFQAIISNNIVKSIYAVVLGSRENRKTMILAFLMIVLTNISLIFFIK
jgi:uncharacterized membrane protein (DUF4010 family)